MKSFRNAHTPKPISKTEARLLLHLCDKNFEVVLLFDFCPLLSLWEHGCSRGIEINENMGKKWESYCSPNKNEKLNP